MPKLTSALLAVFIGFSLIACQKESNEQNASVGNIQGDYKFIGFQAKITNTEQAREGGVTEKMVSITEYTTKENSGTVKIGPSTFTSSNLSYSIDTVGMLYMYSNNTLLESYEFPFVYQSEPYSTSTPYKLVGNDSIYFSAGTFFKDGTERDVQPGGAKLQVEGNKLHMLTTMTQNTTVTEQGVTINSNIQVIMKTTLQKL